MSRVFISPAGERIEKLIILYGKRKKDFEIALIGNLDIGPRRLIPTPARAFLASCCLSVAGQATGSFFKKEAMKIYKSAYVSLSVVSIIISIALGVAFITANKKAELWERRSKELLLVFIDTVKAIDERSDERAGAADDLSKEKERRIHKKKDQLAVYIVSRAKEAVSGN